MQRDQESLRRVKLKNRNLRKLNKFYSILGQVTIISYSNRLYTTLNIISTLAGQRNEGPFSYFQFVPDHDYFEDILYTTFIYFL